LDGGRPKTGAWRDRVTYHGAVQVCASTNGARGRAVGSEVATMPFKKCPKCGQDVRQVDPNCWKCGAGFDGAKPVIPSTHNRASSDFAQVRRKELLRPENAMSETAPAPPARQPPGAAPQVCCPKCGCDQLATAKRGMSITRGLLGWLTPIPGGVLLGALGRNKIRVTCLKCGHQWTAGR